MRKWPYSITSGLASDAPDVPSAVRTFENLVLAITTIVATSTSDFTPIAQRHSSQFDQHIPIVNMAAVQAAGAM